MADENLEPETVNLANKQSNREHWTAEQINSLLPFYSVEELNNREALSRIDPADLQEISEFCTAPDINPRCPSCAAALEMDAKERDEMERQAIEAVVEYDPDEPTTITYPAETPPEEVDVKTAVLQNIDRLSASVVALFNTGIALGPVTPSELADLVFGTAKYIQTMRKMWESGLSVPAETQKAEIDRLAALVERLRS